MTYTLYGAPASLYTGKARAYLRRQGIDFVEVSPGSNRYLGEIVPGIPVRHKRPDGTLGIIFPCPGEAEIQQQSIALMTGDKVPDQTERGPG